MTSPPFSPPWHPGHSPPELVWVCACTRHCRSQAAWAVHAAASGCHSYRVEVDVDAEAA